ncbi:MAG: hypothetical protein IKX63_01565 [Muribaculaceae bacterium]|nr:hypothetical protein [Muribaculaceae bacterium]
MEEKGFVTKRVAELLRLKKVDVGSSTPTVYEVIDWLETKGYWIVYRPLNYFSGVNVSILAADEEDEWYLVNNFVTPTKYEGLNKALEYCLENLIR